MKRSKESTIARLAALAQITRFDVFTALVDAGADGIAAGQIALMLDVAPNTLSAHLGVLHRAGLIVSRRQGRHIIYTIDSPATSEMIETLLRACGQDFQPSTMPVSGTARQADQQS